MVESVETKEKYIQVRVSEEEHEALKRVAELQGISASQFIRNSIVGEMILQGYYEQAKIFRDVPKSRIIKFNDSFVVKGIILEIKE